MTYCTVTLRLPNVTPKYYIMSTAKVLRYEKSHTSLTLWTEPKDCRCCKSAGCVARNVKILTIHSPLTYVQFNSLIKLMRTKGSQDVRVLATSSHSCFPLNVYHSMLVNSFPITCCCCLMISISRAKAGRPPQCFRRSSCSVLFRSMRMAMGAFQQLVTRHNCEASRIFQNIFVKT